MKHLIFSLSLFFASLVGAQQAASLPIVCDKKESVLSVLTGKFGEVPHWIGLDGQGDRSVAILSNNETGTWSFVVFKGEAMCILSSGTDARPLPDTPPAKVKMD